MIYEFTCGGCGLILGTDTDRHQNCSRCGADLQKTMEFGHIIDPNSTDISLPSESSPKVAGDKKPIKKRKAGTKANIRNATPTEVKPEKQKPKKESNKIITDISGDKVTFK